VTFPGNAAGLDLFMPVKRAVHNPSAIYFISYTCYRWRHLFELTQGYDIVYKWLEWLQKKGNLVLGYVIMPNHLHVMLAFPKMEKPLSSFISNGKRFIAYELVTRLAIAGQLNILSEMARGVSTSDFKRGKRHQVFEPSFDWKRCYADWFIEQKLDYMHDNPCKGNWELASCREDYEHSSAGFYTFGRPGTIRIDHYLDVLEMGIWAE